MCESRLPYSLNLGGRLKTLREPMVMGIINVTPDSFYSASRTSADYISAKAEEMLSEGATILDIGGYSTRPNAAKVSPEEEWSRLGKALEAIRKRLPSAVISVDTFRAGIARKCVEQFKVDIVNDISGGDLDPEMFATVAELHVPYILMHTRGTPATMQTLCNYTDVVAEILSDLAYKDGELRRLGVCDVIVDPGFGFAKDTAQNFALLNNLEMFKSLGRPILAGISRKSMVSRTLGCSPAQALNGTTVLNTIALMKGADILRVHDVKEAAEAIRLVGALKESND